MTSIDISGRRIAAHFHQEAPPRAPDGLLTSTLAIIETTPQRRALWRLRVLPRPSRRFPIVNMPAKLGIAAVAVVVGGLALTSFLGLGSSGPAGPEPIPVSPSPSPLLSPSPLPTSSPALSPSPTPAGTIIGAITLTTSGCQWAGNASPLSSGPIRVDAVNATSGYISITLFVLHEGHTFDDMKRIIDGYNSKAQTSTTDVYPFPHDVATVEDTIKLGTGETGDLTADIPPGSVGGFGCFHADGPNGKVLDITSAGPLEFK